VQDSQDVQAAVPAALESGDYYTVMIHFYRGELGRIMTWRQRLDVTTNWAIVATTGIITFSLSSPGNSHLTFIVANAITLLLLVIEGRRYRYYDAFRARVRMLEAHLIMPVMCGEARRIMEGDWRRVMAEDLVMPSFKMSRMDAIARRFRRNYGFIFSIILLAWFLKLWLHYPESHGWEGFARTFLHGSPLPSWLLLAAVVAFYLFLLALWVRAFRSGISSGEFTRGAMHRQKWLV
jgi:uncharacterized membrane protein